MQQQYEHSVEVIRHGGRTGWYVGLKTGDEIPDAVNGYRHPYYGKLIAHWPDGRYTFESKKNHTIYHHTFIPVKETTP